MDHSIQLILPSEEHESAAVAFKNEFFAQGETVINGSALLDQMDYSDWLAHIRRSSKAETADADWVEATTFFAVRVFDNKIVGIIDIRHTIDHPFLKEYGGHIGYAVRPGERRKGYATTMLRLALDYARGIGISKVMLGVFADNLPSVKTVLKNGGVLRETKPFYDGKPVNIYWIR